MKPYGVALGNLASLLGLSALGVAPAWAQVSVPAPSSAPIVHDGAAGGTAVAVVILASLVVLGVGVKLYDMKRRHEDEAAALQGRISDALMTHHSLSGLAITPLIQVPLRPSGLATLTLTGVAPTPELRDAAVQVGIREMERAGMSFCIEDRVVVDPMITRHAA